MNIQDKIEYKYRINILESLPEYSWLSNEQ